jgi:HNH endonuclease
VLRAGSSFYKPDETFAMPPSKSFEQVRAEQLEYIARREQGYRERALKMYPWICGRCAREFERRNLSELTVHHIDHNHDNNPNDGSNWELLCIYCHDEEHSKFENKGRYGSYGEAAAKPATHNPFADLKARMQDKE